jgi:hypothetical protein
MLTQINISTSNNHGVGKFHQDTHQAVDSFNGIPCIVQVSSCETVTIDYMMMLDVSHCKQAGLLSECMMMMIDDDA